jgi:hypothetical protein
MRCQGFAMKTVCLWSGPRNVSTALMYSFAQRPDTRVVDEPLYGHYLRVSGAQHPGRQEILQAMNCDGDALMRDLLARDDKDVDILFLKHMAHHLSDLDLSFLESTENVFLIRDPIEMLPSLTVQLPYAQLADTGLQRQLEVLQKLDKAGQSSAVIDSRELLLDPAGVIGALCEHLGIGFSPRQLHWRAGPISEDGIWAKHWYQAVHKSTCFAKYIAKNRFPARLEPLLDECRPFYEKLFARSIKASNL